jgi:hypothetical protein
MKITFNKVHDIELGKFLYMMRPRFVAPNRQKLGGPLLEEVFKGFNDDMRRITKGAYATAQCDGWTNKSKNKLQAMMFSADGQVSGLIPVAE